jgi:hypothetical protein
MDSVATFPYEASDRKRLRVTGGFGHLAAGMTMDEVGKTLGEPDSEMLHSKPTQAGSRLLYTTWAYYLRRHERRKVTPELDQAIFVYFKPDGTMYWAQPVLVPGLKDIGSTDLHPEGTIEVRR